MNQSSKPIPVSTISTRSEYKRNDLTLNSGIPRQYRRTLRTESGGSSCLDSIPEDSPLDTVFDPPPSLDWWTENEEDETDLTLLKLGNNRVATDSSSTQFSVAITASTMSLAQEHKNTLEDLTLVFSEDFENLNISALAPETLSKKISEADEVKKNFRTAALYLKNNETEFFSTIKETCDLTKKKILDFLKTAEERLGVLRNPIGPGADIIPNTQASSDAGSSGGTSRNSNNSTPMQRFQKERVKNNYGSQLEKLELAKDDLMCLGDREVENDVEYFAFLEECQHKSKTYEELIKECCTLTSEALAVDMETEAITLDTKVNSIKSSLKNIDSKLFKLKTDLGLLGASHSDKNLTLELPKFSGKHGSMDFFSFKKNFLEYTSLVRMSAAKQLHILKVDCITNETLRVSLSRYESVAEILEFLEKHYGDKERMLFSRKDEILNIGRFPWYERGKGYANPCKQRDWLLKLEGKLRELRELVETHNIQHNLYFSDFLYRVEDLFPETVKDDFIDILSKHAEKPTGKELFLEFIGFLSVLINRYTIKANHLSAANPGGKKDKIPVAATMSAAPQDSSDGGTDEFGSGSGRNLNTSSGPEKKRFAGKKKGKFNHTGKNNHVNKDAQYSLPTPKPCPLNCGSEHTHLFYCDNFLKIKDFKQRFKLCSQSKVCMRCLRIDSEVMFDNRDAWWEKHKRDCTTEFYCTAGYCKNRKVQSQTHMLVCRYHYKDNKEKQAEFVKSLDQKQISPDSPFFTFLYSSTTPDEMHNSKVIQDSIPDVNCPSIFMVHEVVVEGKSLMVFYDSGAEGAAISSRGYKYLDCINVKPGPTLLSVAGGESIFIEGGDERFALDLENDKSATFTALKMNSVTTPFPVWNTCDVWPEIKKCHGEKYSHIPLPSQPEMFGGKPVDILLGIKYLKYYPKLLFSLECGLSVYRSQLKCANSHQLVLGGPHTAWKNALEQNNVSSMMFFLSKEARTLHIENQQYNNLLCFDRKDDVSQDAIDALLHEINPEDDHECPPACVDVNCVMQMTINKSFSIKNVQKKMEDSGRIGSEISYRCVGCRGCADCLKGDSIEETSIAEEIEQSNIERNVRLDIENKRLYTTLPFIKDPEANLKPNKKIAMKIFESQKRLCDKNPEMREDLLNSHQKLAKNGFVKKLSELSAAELNKMNTFPGASYTIPWRSVYKSNSVSTPCRLVFDGSSRTPGGESLNGCLGLGKNVLASLYQILLRFRGHKVGMTCDVKLAYNGIFLEVEYYKYQLFLWQDQLDNNNPVEEWVIISIIYGIRPSGTITIVGFKILSKFVQTNHPEHTLGAKKLEEDAYMDDVITGDSSINICEKAAEDITFTLSKGSMSVKAFSFSGRAPPEEVSADGETVGVLGYAWYTKDDELKLDSRDIFLEKIKRGKLPNPVKGNYRDALQLNFTKRTLLRVVASVYDPLGLYTACTATLKLDLHYIMKSPGDWDDDVNPIFLDKWATNLQMIEDLRKIRFKRAVVPVDAVEYVPELLVSCDASESIAIAVVHARYKLKTNEYSCQILTSKSKLVSTSTIPRAELKACRMGAALGYLCKINLGCKTIKYFTDSTIVMHWLNQDERPLQTFVRNAVIEIRRLSDLECWHHVEGSLNVADIGTRGVSVDEIKPGSTWQDGPTWMTLPESEFPVRTFEEIKLTIDEKSQVKKEEKGIKLADIQHACALSSSSKNKILERKLYSNYLPDPSRMSWEKLVKCRAAVVKFVENLKKSVKKEIVEKGKSDPRKVVFSEKEIAESERYFWLKATAEVKKFSPEKINNDFVEQDEIIRYSGRILDGQLIEDVEGLYTDLEPLCFVKPVLDRYSPLSYNIMTFVHEKLMHHRGTQATLNASRYITFILNGRDLAVEVVQKCPRCIRNRAERFEVEMGKLHSHRLAISPSFFYSQVDIFGPLPAFSEHNHRTTIKVYGLIFKCMSTAAVACFCMQSYSTESFVSAFVRFGSRYGYPKKLTIDEGSQLIKACKEMKIQLFDLLKPLDVKFHTGIEFETAPVGHHAATGMAERAIREVRKLFTKLYSGIKLDILQYETAFSYICSELNNMPLFLQNGTHEFDNIDLLTPNRLILGRNNKRAPIGHATMEKPGRLLKQMEKVKQAWWDIWHGELLTEFIPGNSKWSKTSKQPKVGDICLFLRTGAESKIGPNIWRIGRVVEIETSKDGLTRNVTLEYKNDITDKTFKTTRRSIRTIALLLTEDEYYV